MEDLYSIHPMISRGVATEEICQGVAEMSSSDLNDLIKNQISSHPRYPALVSAYIECRKVGAPPEMATLLEDIAAERRTNSSTPCRGEIGADPELDEFMESYCQVLVQYRDELSKPFDEATSFLSSIETQLIELCSTVGGNNSCNGRRRMISSVAVTSTATHSDEVLGTSEEEQCSDDVDTVDGLQEISRHIADHELKEMLRKKYSGYLSRLKKEFLKKRTKGKLPKDARSALMDWWNTHYRWPYPTDEDKVRLAELTGLDAKQINNWFINQRKRHWKPSEDVSFALLQGVSNGGSSGTKTLYFDTGTIGP